MDGEGASRIRREATLPPGSACGMTALAAALEPALVEAAGPGATCVSVSLEFAAPPPAGGTVVVEAWVERATRTLVFAGAEARAGGTCVGAASAIFNRVRAR